MAPHSEEPALAAVAVPASGENTIKSMPQKSKYPQPAKFEDPYEEREYLKGRLAAAFRIFGYGGLNWSSVW